MIKIFKSNEIQEKDIDITRSGKIILFDSKQQYGILKSNGRYVYFPFGIISRWQAAHLHVGANVTFELMNDGEMLIAINIKYKGYEMKRDLRPTNDITLAPIHANRLEVFAFDNLYEHFSNDMKSESDKRGIPKEVYDCIRLTTRGDEFYIVKKECPVKGYFKTDSLEKVALYISSKLGVYPVPFNMTDKFSVINEMLESEKFEKLTKAQIKEKKNKIKNSFKEDIQIKITDPENKEIMIIFNEDGDWFVRHTDDVWANIITLKKRWDLSDEEFNELKTQYKFKIDGNGFYFKTQSQATGFAREILVRNAMKNESF